MWLYFWTRGGKTNEGILSEGIAQESDMERTSSNNIVPNKAWWTSKATAHMDSYLSVRRDTGNNIHTTAARIATEEGRIDGFLKYMPAFFAVKSLTRKLLLWRTGCIPGKLQKCLA